MAGAQSGAQPGSIAHDLSAIAKGAVQVLLNEHAARQLAYLHYSWLAGVCLESLE